MTPPEGGDPRTSLRADCSQCAALCCVAPAFTRSADFAIDKPAGRACPHLADDFGCTIHRELRDRGFPGCAVFDCFGAGQHVVQVAFAGREWRTDPHLAASMFAVFAVMRQLKELLWYLTESVDKLPPARFARKSSTPRQTPNASLRHRNPILRPLTRPDTALRSARCWAESAKPSAPMSHIVARIALVPT